MRLAEGIRQLIQARGLKQEWLAAQAGMPAETLSRIATGTTPNPGIETVQKIAAGAGITVGELLGETGFDLTAVDRDTLRTFRSWIDRKLEPERDARLEPNAVRILLVEPAKLAPVVALPGRALPRASRIADASSEIPVNHGRAAADPNRQIPPGEDLPEREIPSFYAGLGATKVFKVEGDSMIDAGITPHDLLFVRVTDDVQTSDGEIVVCEFNGGTFVKQLDVRPDQIRLLSANRRYSPMVVDSTVPFALVGVVVGRSGYPLKPPKPPG